MACSGVEAGKQELRVASRSRIKDQFREMTEDSWLEAGKELWAIRLGAFAVWIVTNHLDTPKVTVLA